MGQQVLDTGAGLRAAGHAEGGAEGPGPALPLPRRGPQLHPDALSRPSAHLDIGSGEPQRKFLPAGPGRDIAGPDLVPDQPADMNEGRISGRMAQGVVEPLEMIDIE